MYDISPALLEAISRVESNHTPSAINNNVNGSTDYGHMQINSFWHDYLGELGWNYLLEDPCYCTKVGAWILKMCIDRYGNSWDAISCYHVGKAIDELSESRKRIAWKYVFKIHDILYPE